MPTTMNRPQIADWTGGPGLQNEVQSVSLAGRSDLQVSADPKTHAE
jgi:hypothetical protein